MTEQPVPFGGTAVAAPPAAPEAPVFDDDGAEAANRRKLAIVGAVAGVIVLLVVAFFLMHGKSGNSASGAFVPKSSHPAVKGSAPAPSGAHPVRLPKAYHGPVGRDPFKPLYVVPAAPSGGGSTSSTSTGSSGTPAVGGAPGSAPGTTGAAATPPPGYAPVWVELRKVKGTRSATFVIDYSNGHKQLQLTFADVVPPKDTLRTTFARVFALLSLQDGTATVQFGDGTPFDLSPGLNNRHFVG
jgi:hypothetical protein